MPVPIDGPSLPLALAGQLRDVARPDPTATDPAAFGRLLEGAVGSANTRALEAAQVASEFAAGKRDDIHGTMIALSKADIELRMIGNVRNKIVDAFYEIWRMQV